MSCKAGILPFDRSHKSESQSGHGLAAESIGTEPARGGSAPESTTTFLPFRNTVPSPPAGESEGDQSKSAYLALHFGIVTSGALCVPNARCPWAPVRTADPTIVSAVPLGCGPHSGPYPCCRHIHADVSNVFPLSGGSNRMGSSAELWQNRARKTAPRRLVLAHT